MSRKRAMIAGARLRSRDGGWDVVRPCQREIDRFWRTIQRANDALGFPHHYAPQPGLPEDWT